MRLLRVLAAGAFAAIALSAHAVGHLADIRIYDRAAGRELPIHWHKGRAYVAGHPGNEYAISVRNKHGEDLLAVVSIDGVNVLSGETAGPHQGGYVLGPRESTCISGWRKSLDETAAFYFTALGDSYAARTDRPQHVGVIGVALFQRKLPPPPPPRIEEPLERYEHSDAAPARRAEPQAGIASRPFAPTPKIGTGHGRREQSHVHYVEFERRTSAPAEIVTIYYDSHRNLVAQGVIAAPRRPADPNPFPTRFAPDPWR